MLDDKRRRYLMYHVCYTICKYFEQIDFMYLTGIPVLEFRHFASNLIALKKDYDERKRKNGK